LVGVEKHEPLKALGLGGGLGSSLDGMMEGARRMEDQELAEWDQLSGQSRCWI